MTVSWLLLERYALDDVSADERASVEAALAADPEASRRLAQIRSDARPLPPLALGPDSGLPLPEPQTPRGRGRWWGVAAGMALAAGLLFAVRAGPPGSSGAGGVRGGELVLSLETPEGPLAEGATVQSGTVIQARVTWDKAAEVQLLGDGEVLWVGELPGGNRQRIPAAWAVEAGPVEICVVVADQRACRRLTGER